MQASLTPNQTQAFEQKKETFAKPVGFMASLFGCWHPQVSRPFTTVDESYRVCVECGAHRKFNPVTLETTGRFYFPQKATITRSN